MGIRFQCPSGHSLNVKSFLAGKRGVCPKCGVKHFIPKESGGVAIPVPRRRSKSKAPVPVGTLVRSHGASADPLLEDPNAKWYIRPKSGGQFGPADAETMRVWIDEGRVSGDSLVWREGWADWKEACITFPHLASQGSDLEDHGLREVSPHSNFETPTLESHFYPGSRREPSSTAIAIIVLMVILIILLLAGFIYVLSRHNFSPEEAARLQSAKESRISAYCELT